jgi:Mn2+/Fe2+ NRAMP family transporter
MLDQIKKLGPGLLYAGAAVGVSHIVQSTRAGADYGYILLVAVLLAHIFKYPFFEMGPRYAAATGKSLVQGYAKTGKWALYTVSLLTISTMFTIQAAVTIVTAGLAQKITGINLESWQWSAIILAVCFLFLYKGAFNILDNLMKVIMVVLAVTTLIALGSSFYAVVPQDTAFMKDFSLFNSMDVMFLIAFIGWMPAPLDISIWHSIWSLENFEKNKAISTIKEALFDFKIGYWGTAILAGCFLILGANILYGTPTVLSANGAVYAGQLIDMYGNSIGQWSYWIIAIAAFTTMFSTTITCLDAQPRVLTALWREIKESGKTINQTDSKKQYRSLLVLLAAGTIIILAFFVANMKQMVTVATSISFLTAPLLAWINYKTVFGQLPIVYQPPKWLKVLAIVGLVFLILFSIYYIFLAF